jgi:hypothetical protein
MNEPLERRDGNLTKPCLLPRGQLRNGNRSGDLAAVPRCGACTRSRGGQPCRAPAMRGKRRCRLHGGLSTGPRTPEGLARSRRARWKHGRYSQEARDQVAAARAKQAADTERAAMERDVERMARQVLARLFR